MIMRGFLIACFVLALVVGPAAAAEASDPVTWGSVATIGAYAGLGFLALIAVALVLVILFTLIGGFNDWSH